MRPTTARVRLDGVDRDLPINAILVGGVVVIRPGDRVPVDGEIPEGNSRDDESLLTGESLPVDKQPGDTLNGGAINAHGIRVARTTAVGLVMGGGWGLLLGMPIIMMIKAICDRVEDFKPIGELLGK